MKQIGIIAITAMLLLGTSNCTTERKSNVETNQELSVTGEIIAIEKGTDGYMATLKDSDGKEYIATISIVNLSKSGGEYKAHNVGDNITVRGNSWKDDKGKIHITVTDLK